MKTKGLLLLAGLMSAALLGASAQTQVPAVPEGAPVPTTVEDIMTAQGTIFIDNPNIGGKHFLAVSASENYNYESTSKQITRAQQLCNFLGYDKPTVVEVAWHTGSYTLATIAINGDVTTAAYTSALPYAERSFASFSRIGCKKKV